MKKKRFRIKTLSKVGACCIVMLVGFVLLCFAIYYQQRIVTNNEFLSKMAGKSIPKAYYDYIVSFNASVRTTIPMLATIGIMLCIVGGFLLFLPRKMILSFSLLTVILFSNLPIIAYGKTTETERLYAQLDLQQPRNAGSIGGHVYVFDNHLSSTNPNAFVAFRIGLVRIDPIYGGVGEWLEAGYFENQSGFWIYGASYIGGEYVENDVTRLSGEGTNGEGYLTLTIGQSEPPDTFTALMYDVPGPGIWWLMEATFTIGGDNLYSAGSESNDQCNSLNGHYAELWFSDGDNSYAWQDVEPRVHDPYYLSMGASNNEFFTEGGDFRTLTISASPGGTTIDPVPGTYTYNLGSSETVTANAYPGYTFDHWLLDGATVYGIAIDVTMDSDHTLEAHFESSGSPGGGCPILSVFDGLIYVSEGLLDIHNPDGIDVVYEHTLTTEPAWTNGRYQLRLVEHPKTHSYIDQVKLYAMLEDGTETELPLTYAWHSEHGNVLPRLLFSDEWKTDTLGADLNNGTSQSIDLKFSALPPNLQATSFIFQIEGNNRALKIP